MSDSPTAVGPTPAQLPGETSALDGEPGIPSVTQAKTVRVSRKAVVAVALFALSLLIASAVSIQRTFFAGKKESDSQRVGNRPTAAAAEPRRLDMTPAPASAAPPAPRMIPAIEPLPGDERAEPIPVRPREPIRIAPEDAPVVLLASRGAASTTAARADRSDNTREPLADTRRSLEAYQQQLQGLIDAQKGSDGSARSLAATTPPSVPRPTAAAPAPGVFGGQLQASATPRVHAATLAQQSLTLPKGTAFTCALKTKIISASSGLVSCQVQRDVYGDDGRVVLIERGSHLDGEYRITAVKPGTVRIPVLWTRIRTPHAVTVDIDSPGTGALGESGIDGYVDNRWPERVGAALLLSLIDDAMELALRHESQGTQGNVVLASTTSTSTTLAEKVLDSTINIPPLIYQNQGAIVGIIVARDVDFSSVYELKATER